MNNPLSAYHIFYEVAKAGSFSKATNQLYISQPAISKSIQKLEDALHTRLFLRNSKGVRLTPEGQLLFQHLDTAFSAITSAETKLETLTRTDGGTLHIGVSTTLCKYLLLPYLSAFIREHPQINIRIRCQSSNETLKMLADDAIDIGLVGMPEHKAGFIYENLVEIEDIFVATSTYMSHLPQDMTSTREILEASTLMLLDKNNMTRQYIDDYLAKNQIQTKDYIEISNMDLLPRSVSVLPVSSKTLCRRNWQTDSYSRFRLTSPSISVMSALPTKRRICKTMRCPAFLIFAVARQCDSKLRGSRWLAGAGDGLVQYAGGKLSQNRESLTRKICLF